MICIVADTDKSKVMKSPAPVEAAVPPLFVTSPHDSYIIKNKPVTLSCKAIHAVKSKYNNYNIGILIIHW